MGTPVGETLFHLFLDHNGPVYLPLCRNPMFEVPVDNREFVMGKGYEGYPGKDVTV